MLKQKSKVMLQEYYDIKRMFELPLKIRLYFSTLEGLLDKSQSHEINKQQVVDYNLVKAYQKQSEEEKVSYLLYMMKSLQTYYQRDDMQKNEQISEKPSPTINNIETSCNMEVFSFRLSHWVSCKFKFDKLKRNVLILNKRKNFTLNLKQYLVRKSKKNSCTVVFQAFHKDISSEHQKISLQFKQEIYAVIYQELFEVIADNIKENLLHIAKESIDQPEVIDRQGQIPVGKSLAFLTSEQLTNYLNYKTQILQRLQVGGFSFKSIYHKQNGEEGIKIERSSKIDKIFKLECLIKRSKQEIKTDFLDSINSKYKYKIVTNVLEEFSKKYRAVYEKYLINNKIYEQLCIKQQSNSQKEQIYFSKGMQNVLTGNYLQFLIAKVKPTQNANINKLIVVVSLIIGRDINLEIAMAFLLEFREMLDRKQNFKSQIKESEGDDDEFFSIVEEDDQENHAYEIDSDQIKTDRVEMVNELMKKQKYTHTNFTNKFFLHPQELSPEEWKEKKVKEHHFKNVWGRQKKGGIVCINEAMNIEQRNVLKKIVANVGSNIYKLIKSGNIMNYSLPLGIFKKASHLELIGNNLAYAPILFDRFYKQENVDVLERFKSAILLNISISNLGISLQKPFNPILGETLQCWIGGCPLYLEQISHHPPISCYFFEGRGYKIHGCIDPKLSVGLNSISCWSERPNYIEFDDGSKICLTFGRMLMSGFIFGDRTFNYEEKNYVYDMKNNLFCIMQYGPKKKGAPKNDAVDYVHGKIYKTSPELLKKFIDKTSLYPDKKDIQSELSFFQGIWNQSISFDNKQYINFSTELPHIMQKQQFPLPSNYTFRKDLSYYLEDDVKNAQEQKEYLEEVQRRDRKMREKYKQ